jgi:hypothetical protein
MEAQDELIGFKSALTQQAQLSAEQGLPLCKLAAGLLKQEKQQQRRQKRN